MTTKYDCYNTPVYLNEADCGYQSCAAKPSIAYSHVASAISGLDNLNKAKLNKGLCYTAKERRILHIEGLIPPAVRSEETELKLAMELLDRQCNDLNKYMYLVDLVHRNERLFYKLAAADIKKIMPLVYTPTVGLACQKFSLINTQPIGFYITIKDKGHIASILRNWPEANVRVICVTDGERILGLGDLGANGMPIPMGKLMLDTAVAGIKPEHCMPILLDCGTNREELRKDPLYVGLRQPRISGKVFDDFVEEFMQAVRFRFGQNCLIHYEDFGNANAFRILEKYRNSYCTFNDDIQGTASVALAGLLGAMKMKKCKIMDNCFVFFGAGEAALGAADLLVAAMLKEGLAEDVAREHIWLMDSKGLIVLDRPRGGLNAKKLEYAKKHQPIDNLLDVIKICKPNVLIGVSTMGGAFTPEILQLMAEINEVPVIFPLSNPTPKAECTAQQAYTYTEGRVVFASGSPFPSVNYNGKVYTTGQCNNAYIYPGVTLGVIAAGAKIIPDEIFLDAADRLASLTSEQDMAEGNVFPALSKLACCSLEIAVTVMETTYRMGLATVWPEPKDKRAHLRANWYDLNYPSAVPDECFNNCISNYKKEKKERKEKRELEKEKDKEKEKEKEMQNKKAKEKDLPKKKEKDIHEEEVIHVEKDIHVKKEEVTE